MSTAVAELTRAALHRWISVMLVAYGLTVAVNTVNAIGGAGWLLGVKFYAHPVAFTRSVCAHIRAVWQFARPLCLMP